jgi:hypothetical protein
MRKQLVGARALGLALGSLVLGQLPIAAQESAVGLPTESANRPTVSVPAANSPAVPGRMSCGTARLVSAPLGAGAGALGTFLLYELVTATTSASRTQTFASDVQTPGSGRTALMLVGGGLGMVWGILAPPVSRDCWIQLPGRGGSGSRAAEARRAAPPSGRLGFSQP